MSRPPLPFGTAGRIAFVAQPSGRVQARSWVRDLDGRTRQVTKTGTSKAAAERALKVRHGRPSNTQQSGSDFRHNSTGRPR